MQWGILGEAISFMVNPLLSAYSEANSRRAKILPGTRQVVLFVEFTKGTSGLDVRVETTHQEIGGMDNFFVRVISDGSGNIIENEMHFGSSGKYRIPIALVEGENYIRVSVKSAGGDGSVKLYIAEG